MKNTFLLFLMLAFLSGMVRSQSRLDSVYNPNEIIVRLNYKLLDWNTIDNEHILNTKVENLLNDEGLKALENLPNNSIDLGELQAVKIFPNLRTSDSLSRGRQGNIVRTPPFWATFKIRCPKGLNVSKLGNELMDLYPLVIYAHLIPRAYPTNIPNDSLFFDQTALYNPLNPNTTINVDSAWNIETGRRFVKVGIFDSGIDTLHPDLKVLGGHAYEDDIYFDTLTQQESSFWGTDKQGHGTSVAGIIGAKRNNNVGIAGIAGGNGLTDTSGVSLLNFSLGNPSLGWDANWISQALIDASRAPMSYHNWGLSAPGSFDYPNYWYNSPGWGISVGNHSYSYIAETEFLEGFKIEYEPGDTITWDPPEPIVQQCILCRESFLYSLQNGVTNVVSRGNGVNFADMSDPNEHYPAAHHDSWIISVGATGNNGERLEGPANTDSLEGMWYSPIGYGLDVLAPGSISNVITTRSSQAYGFDTYGYYRRFNGTSAAAPHVTGVVALLLSYYNRPCYSNQNLDPADVEYIIERSATPIGYTSVPNDTVGWGRLNAFDALKMIELPKYQIIHPQDIYIDSQLVKVDTITLKVNTPLFPNANGPISSTFPAELDQTYLVERYQYQLTYDFSQYILPTTQLLDSWVRHSQTNSLARFEDTMTVYNGTLVTLEVDELTIEPMAIIDTVISDSIIKMTGYYYHFIEKYDNNVLDYPPIQTVDYWYPIDPNEDTLKMAYSIYIKDDSLSNAYYFGCDSSNILVDTTLSILENTMDQEGIFIYPNPTNSVINVVLDNNLIGGKVLIHNALGQMLIEERMNSDFLSINISFLTDGIYFLTYIDQESNEKYNRKWIKK